MPILTQATGIPVITASIWECTMVGETGSMPYTPAGFWAVMAVMTVVAKPPKADMVFISACMPAPPLLSDPAMLNTTGGVCNLSHT